MTSSDRLPLTFGLRASAEDFPTVLSLAQAAEDAGFTHITFADRPHDPVMDGWTLSTAVAARTEKIRVSHMTLNIPFRYPAVLAKEAATLDLISGGRLDLILGAGDDMNRPLYDSIGVPLAVGNGSSSGWLCAPRARTGPPGAAANRGACDGKGRSIGLNIKLPHEQSANSHADTVIHFDYFFARKVMFVKYACAFVGLPGGYGTLDEMFECLTLKQTSKMKNFPVILYGADFWQGLLDWLRDHVRSHGLISDEDLELFHVTDSPEEVARIVYESWHSRECKDERLDGKPSPV